MFLPVSFYLIYNKKKTEVLFSTPVQNDRIR